jgi:hypothetical protein
MNSDKVQVYMGDVAAIFSIHHKIVIESMERGELPYYRPFEGSRMNLIYLSDADKWYESLSPETRTENYAVYGGQPNRRRYVGSELRKRDLARHISSDAHRCGFLVRQPCRDCGKEPAYAHHWDYDQPLSVIYLCPKHHSAEHARIDPGYPRWGQECLWRDYWEYMKAEVANG